MYNVKSGELIRKSHCSCHIFHDFIIFPVLFLLSLLSPGWEKLPAGGRTVGCPGVERPTAVPCLFFLLLWFLPVLDTCNFQTHLEELICKWSSQGKTAFERLLCTDSVRCKLLFSLEAESFTACKNRGVIDLELCAHVGSDKLFFLLSYRFLCVACWFETLRFITLFLQVG